MSAIVLLPLPVVILIFVFIFFYGIASGETDHFLWQSSSVAMGIMVVAGIVLYQYIS